jgi:hypothetical protein
VLLHKPEKTFLKNNKPSIEHKHFVDTAIVELLKGGLVKEMSNRPHVLNPLTVSNNGEGKERLILDLRLLMSRFYYNGIECKADIVLTRNIQLIDLIVYMLYKR